MAKTKTHFEQVPLSEIEELLETAEFQGGGKRPRVATNVSVETPATKTEPYSVQKTV
jgi:hypothetical protein